MANHDSEIYTLGQAIKVKGKDFDKLSPEDFGFLGSALQMYLVYCKAPVTLAALDPRISEEKDNQKRIEAFHSGIVPSAVLQDIINYLSKAEETEKTKTEKEKEPEKKEETKEETPFDEEESPRPLPQPPENIVTPQKEEIAIPTNLAEMVEELRNQKTAEINIDKSHSVADDVKRARATFAKIQQRSDRQKEADIQYFIDKVEPKSGTREVIVADIKTAARQAVIYQASNLGIGLNDPVIEKAINDLVYMGISGSVDLTDFNDLNVVSQLVFKFEGKNITSPINEVDDAVLAWQHAVEIEPYSDTPDKLEQNIFQAEKEVGEYLKSSTFVSDLEKNNPDFIDNAKAAQTKLEKIQVGLLDAIPNPVFSESKNTPLSQHAAALETALRQVDPQLRINPNEIAAQAAGLLDITHGENRNVSSEAVLLLGIGLTPEKLAAAEVIARDNPNSPLGTIFFKDGKHTDVYAMVHHQIGKIAKSKLGQEILEKNKNLSGLSQSLNTFYNNNSAIRVTKGVIDPIGTAKSWAGREAGRQIGQRLIEYSGSALAQKLGGFLIENGLELGIKKFISAAGKQAFVKVAGWAATKLGISLALESFSPLTLGATTLIDIGLQIAMFVGEKTIGALYNGFQNLAENVYGEKIKARDLLAPLVGLGGLAAAAFGGLVIISRTVQIAVVSAIGIIIGSLITIGLYLGFAYLVAPMLSTLVQFDAYEKVDYSQYQSTAVPSSDCGWPTKGHYPVIEGADGGTHHLSHLQAIDIAAPGGSPHLSATSGIVIYTGVYSNYGNTVHVQTKNSAGSFVVIYGHLTGIFVSKGQQIAQGKPIGIVGGSGGWSPHIHMEYKGIKYNQCPAGGKKIKDGCVGFVACGSVYTN